MKVTMSLKLAKLLLVTAGSISGKKMAKQRVTLKKALIMLFITGLLVAGQTPTPAQAEVEFTSGIASGDVTHTRAILWTRVDRAALLFAQVARDSDFEQTVRFIPVVANPEADLTVKVDVRDLKSGTTYFYRFVHFSFDRWTFRKVVTDTGTFLTAPPPHRSEDVRFAFSGDSDINTASFDVLAAVENDAPDFFVYLGDTIYPNDDLLSPPEESLNVYRAAYRAYRNHDFLKNLLASTSVYAIWDDHEVIDDFAGQTVDPTLLANGLQAFLEYWPIRMNRFDPNRLFRRFRWGQDVELFILDERQYRSASAEEDCLLPPLPPGFPEPFPDPFPTLPPEIREEFELPPVPRGCLEALADPSRTMLGEGQIFWLALNLLFSDATFKIIINEVPIGQLFVLPYDRWEGYLAEREGLLQFIRLLNIPNVIFLTTDLHGSVILDVAPFLSDGPVAKEVIVGPIARRTAFDGLSDELGGPDRVAEFIDLLAEEAPLPPTCVNLNTFSYALVEVDSQAQPKEMTITVKDAGGFTVKDFLDENLECSITIQAE